MLMQKKQIAIIGGGAAALSLAAHLDMDKFDVCIYEKNKKLARKFLVAGDGGLNLSHSEDLEKFISRYTPNAFLKNALSNFTSVRLREWLLSLGIETFVGTSGRIFPEKKHKPNDVLEAIVSFIKQKDVVINYEHEFIGFSKDGHAIIQNKNGVIELKHQIIVFALGGASWKVTGANSKWLDYFKNRGIKVNSFEASNCAVKINWPIDFIEKNHGKALKNISINAGEDIKLGEAVITKFGMEGNAVYAHSPFIREGLNKYHEANITIDLKPSYSIEEIIMKLNSINKNKSRSESLKKIMNINGVALDLLYISCSKDEFKNNELLAKKIKSIPVKIVAMADIDEAISTVGGIDLAEVSDNFELKKLPNHYCIGEMLDWDAPTGGYLLQACFSMGNHLANYLNKKNLVK